MKHSNIFEKIKTFYLEAISTKKSLNLYRSPVSSDAISDVIIRRNNQALISFACNDYFSLSHNPNVKKAAIDAIQKYGVGARGSRYVTGNNSLYVALESQLAAMKGCDDSIVFASGYAAAIGVIPALVSKRDLIVADRLIHSSLIDGAKLSGAKLMRFVHNDVAACRKVLEENRGKFDKCLIVTETVFSMDGDCGPVEELLALAVEFDGLLISDAAHDLWLGNVVEGGPRHEDGATKGGDVVIQGEGESGVTQGECEDGVTQGGDEVRKGKSESGMSTGKGGMINKWDNVTTDCHPVFMTGSINPQSHHLQMGTFSKAVGTLGGYICGDKDMIDYLRNFAKSAIYSTALPPAVLAATLASLKIIEKENFESHSLEEDSLGQKSLGQRALENAEYFCELMGLQKPESAIVVMIIGDNNKVIEIAQNLEKQGLLISAIRPPTVEVGKARLRITFSTHHSKQQIQSLVKKLLHQIGSPEKN